MKNVLHSRRRRCHHQRRDSVQRITTDTGSLENEEANDEMDDDEGEEHQLVNQE